MDSQKSWEARLATLSLEAASGLRRLAEPIPAGDRIKAQIARAARKAGLTYSRAFEIWYGRARRIDAHELDAIRNAQVKRGQERTDEIACIAQEFEQLAERAAKVMALSDRRGADAFRRVAERARRLAAGT